jgi:hypothetical protein
MDEVLEIWQDLCVAIVGAAVEEAALDFLSIFK